MELQCFLSADALYIVQCECRVFPLFTSHMLPIVLPDYRENSMHKSTFHASIYCFPNICVYTVDNKHESCMACMKSNIFHAVSPITHVNENLNCNVCKHLSHKHELLQFICVNVEALRGKWSWGSLGLDREKTG